MKTLTFLFALLFTSQTFANCPMEFVEVDLCGELTWTDGPHLNQKSQFKVEFWRKGDDKEIRIEPGFDVEIYSWMIMESGMSHGGPKMTLIKSAVGVFEVHDARFFMGNMKGYWEVRVELLEDLEDVSMAAHRVEFN
jgi:hypothetical protein